MANERSSKTPKKSSFNTPKQAVQEPKKPSFSASKTIEEIFSKKRKARKVGEKKRSKSAGSNVDVFENERGARPRRKTGDGLVVYTEEELGIGKPDAGGKLDGKSNEKKKNKKRKGEKTAVDDKVGYDGGNNKENKNTFEEASDQHTGKGLYDTKALQQRIDDYILNCDAKKEQEALDMLTIFMHNQGRKKTRDPQTGTIMSSFSQVKFVANKQERTEAEKEEMKMLQSRLEMHKK